MALPVEKGPDAFRTISEVAEDLDLPQHVLRFWETRFTQIKPLKRGGGRRFYRPDDIDLLRGIRHLLYGDGYTIRGVQQILREQGVRHVQSIGRGEQTEAAPPARPSRADSFEVAEDPRLTRAQEGAGLIDLMPSLRARPEPARAVAAPVLTHAGTESELEGEEEKSPFAFRPVPPATNAFSSAPTRSAADPARLLKATLFELTECKRILDAATREEG